VLHPSLKLEYFRLRKWDQDWIDTALQLVKDEFDSSYDGNGSDIEILDSGDAVGHAFTLHCSLLTSNVGQRDF
jgi:hypothetical protein